MMSYRQELFVERIVDRTPAARNKPINHRTLKALPLREYVVTLCGQFKVLHCDLIDCYQKVGPEIPCDRGQISSGQA